MATNSVARRNSSAAASSLTRRVTPACAAACFAEFAAKNEAHDASSGAADSSSVHTLSGFALPRCGRPLATRIAAAARSAER